MTSSINGKIETELQSLGIDFNQLPQPGGHYIAVNIRSNIAFVAIQFPISGKDMLFRGRLGESLDTAAGYQAARLCAANVIAQLHRQVKWDAVIGLNHIEVFYQQAGDWDEAPQVADGASHLFTALLSEKGLHTRSLIGVAHLPRHFSVGVTASFTLNTTTHNDQFHL